MAEIGPSKERPPVFDGIQCLRFVAALMVVVLHSTFYASERLTPGSDVWRAGMLGVDIFFVISGFVMFASSAHLASVSGGWKDFAVKRLIRIVPLYWLVTSLKLAILLAAPAVVLHSQVDWAYIAKSYFFVPAYNVDGNIEPLLGVGWTLIFEMFFYAIFTLALLFRLPILPTIGAVLAACAVGSLFRQDGWSAWSIYLDMRVLEFLAGMLIARFMVGRALPLWGGAFAALAGFTIILLFPADKAGLGALATMVLPATLIVLGVVAMEPHLAGRWPKSLTFLGAASYSLYLIHPIVAPGVPAVLNKIGIAIHPLSVLGSVSAAVITGVALYALVERPVTNRLNRWSKRRTAPQPSVIPALKSR